MLTYRELPEEEFHRIQSHPFLNGLTINPEATRFIVAERADGEIVGFQALVQVIHVEPIWVHPDYRGKMVAFRLFNMAIKLLDQIRCRVAYVFSQRSDTDDYLDRLGLRELPYKTFIYDPDHIYVED